MEIHRAKPDEVDEIIALQTQIYRVESAQEGADDALRKQLEDDTCDVLVAEDEGKVVATAAIYYIEVPVRNRPYALLEGLVVDETERGRGIATQMFDKVYELVRERNCYKIIFTSSEERKSAHGLYEKLGFKKWGVEFRMDL